MTQTNSSSTHTSPLSQTYAGDTTDRSLVQAVIAGDRQALEQLIRRHQGFLFSLAQRMLYSTEDAADATQEILICIVTSLASYRGEAAFRTWAYRIAVRQLLAFRKGRVEQVVHSFDCFAQTLDAIPDMDLPDQNTLPADVRLVVEEAKVGCLMAMLLCLDREQRMAFTLGEIFEASDTVMGEVLGISSDNARQRLARARQQLRLFLAGRCSLMDTKGTCHCDRKTQGFIQKGIVDPTQLKFTQIHLDHTKAQAAIGARNLQGYVEGMYAEHLRSQPTVQFPKLAEVLRTLFNRSDVLHTLQIGN